MEGRRKCDAKQFLIFGKGRHTYMSQTGIECARTVNFCGGGGTSQPPRAAYAGLHFHYLFLLVDITMTNATSHPMSTSETFENVLLFINFLCTTHSTKSVIEQLKLSHEVQ